ncbi:glycosyltransferase [Polyangium fumosum]|uniref:Glycosyltransferase family 2 protein n=1 Tax=Polyangium fumosum TaxID=889272 RepID=A0A4U1J3A5_9BACT|nr:glycosyltransferase [Polyangium fumosum]TKD01505.1 glycosyltransferase family 2 protein [Polyangium fumosum]
MALGALIWLLRILDLVIVGYVTLFFLINLRFVLVSYRRIRHELTAELVRPASLSERDAFLPVVSLLVPAYNEEVTIVESLKSQLRLRYPAYEIVICNDGSKDRTVEVLLSAYPFVPAVLERASGLDTAEVRGMWECRTGLPENVKRMVLIDKENGGKADALNAATSVAAGEFVTSMDADSLLVPDALLLAVRKVMESPDDTVAVGVQVGLSNGSTIREGEVKELALPTSLIGKLQIVEYMRSFAKGRTALSEDNAVLILSGVFALIRRDVLFEVGGFLTRHVRSRICIEYCTEGAHTVCEDMEIVVRLHRYLLDKGRPGRIVCLPFAVTWTEAPENYRDLGKQRARWYRGLWEVMSYHRAMLFRPQFRQIGLFAMPYQLVFEALAPPTECVGYLLLVLTSIFGALSGKALLAFMGLAMAMNFCLSTLSIVLCTFSARPGRGHAGTASLVPYPRARDAIVLLFVGILSNLGYRQYLVFWQLRGLYDFLKGKKGWDKFGRKGFAPAAPAAQRA